MEENLFNLDETEEAASAAEPAAAPGADMPLAARLRPRKLSEYIGQTHLLGEGQLLRRAIDADRFSSIILSGPPGTGKTSLAEVVAVSAIRSSSGFRESLRAWQTCARRSPGR